MRQSTFFYFAMIDNIPAIHTQILLVNNLTLLQLIYLQG